MKKFVLPIAGSTLCLLAGLYFVIGWAAQAQRPQMTFFVTSVGMADGANFGGLAEADSHCLDLYRNATGDRSFIWRAYLSTQERPGKTAINARDRIGPGPWQNAQGMMVAENVEHLHSDENNINPETVLNEFGLNGINIGAPPDPRDQSWAYMKTHPNSVRPEIITGSQADGRAFPPGTDHTCNNYTSKAEGTSVVRARLNEGPGVEVGSHGPGDQWNSHGISGGCNFQALARSHGAGLFYCFAAGTVDPIDAARMVQ